MGYQPLSEQKEWRYRKHAIVLILFSLFLVFVIGMAWALSTGMMIGYILNDDSSSSTSGLTSISTETDISTIEVVDYIDIQSDPNVYELNYSFSQ